MADRILVMFLDAGLLELKGQDAWFDNITRAADHLAKHLVEHPQEFAQFVYSAIDPSDRNGDPARAKALETLKSVWRTFSSVSIGSLDMVLRSIILDAVVQNANQDSQTKLALTLLLSSALPHVELGAEAKVWQPTLDQLVNDIEADAEIQWSVPAEVELPPLPTLAAPTLTGRLGGIKIDEDALVTGMQKAVGPTTAEGQQTGGNAHWPNQHQPWAHAFALLAAKAINEGLQTVAGTRSYNLKTDELLQAVRDMVEGYIGTVAARLTAAALGVDLRSRLLWWNEAKISPSARVEYRALSPSTAAGLMAFDYQKMLPPLAPASVIAFLREAVRSLTSEATRTTFVEYLESLSKADEFAGFRKGGLPNDDACRPLAVLVAAGISDSETINRHTVFSSETLLKPEEFSALLFLELQAMEAIRNIASRVRETEAEGAEEGVAADAPAAGEKA